MKPSHIGRTRWSFGRLAAAVAATSFVGLVAVTFALRDAPAPDYPAAEPAAAANGELVQTFSPFCQTPAGVCTLPSALPIGSPCSCDGVEGRVIP